MEPIPETLAAINELNPAVDEVALLGQLTSAAEQARAIAPCCVGVSVTAADIGVTFTLVARSDEITSAGVRSTLTFPVTHAGHAFGSVHLYGESEDAFTGRHEELAAVFGAWAPAAVVDADLSFSTRAVAEQAPARFREQARIDAATGILAAAQGIDIDGAHHRLRTAAERAGIPLNQVAEILLVLNHG